MQHSQRVSFCIQLGASLTFARFSGTPRALAGRIRRATSVFHPAPRVLYSSRPVRVKKRALSIRSVKSITNKSVRMAKRVASSLRSRAGMGSSASFARRGRAYGPGKPRSCWSRCWCSLLLHVNLLLMMYVGAALATAARLRWDPSTYVVVRELIPAEYALAQLGLLAGAAALLALAQLAALALHSRYRCRRWLLIIYALVMLAMLTVEAVVGYQVMTEVEQQMAAGRAQLQALLDAVSYTMDAITKLELPGLEIIDQIPNLPDLLPTLPQLPDITLPDITLPDVTLPEIPDISIPDIGRHSNVTIRKPRQLPNIQLNMNIIKKLQTIIEDVKQDAPMNIEVAMMAIYVLAALQASAVVLALLAAVAEPARRPAAAAAAAPPRCLRECPVYDA
ncbi:uncharacterized protein [Epargyreus clarus]|uniref:uncharacterized protein n=1 Tax=Epargyreus clarus TaxID=520877 RepID=UPI003C2EDBCF